MDTKNFETEVHRSKVYRGLNNKFGKIKGNGQDNVTTFKQKRNYRYQRKGKQVIFLIGEKQQPLQTFWICPANSLVGDKIKTCVSRTYNINQTR